MKARTGPGIAAPGEVVANEILAYNDPAYNDPAYNDPGLQRSLVNDENDLDCDSPLSEAKSRQSPDSYPPTLTRD
ncbi:hypothetical protein CA13_22170 [Planctomycetes bacterium CA13]|uniref:Uncharacterized protein n=1 Tax=Novipirellula herctigrandis TaxID=2527986 RepID=A0A5C5Z1S6_9BACT|nr:hypothetical protein CA13_22170 [Planctomycetes bacterium CA13]